MKFKLIPNSDDIRDLLKLYDIEVIDINNLPKNVDMYIGSYNPSSKYYKPLKDLLNEKFEGKIITENIPEEVNHLCRDLVNITDNTVRLLISIDTSEHFEDNQKLERSLAICLCVNQTRYWFYSIESNKEFLVDEDSIVVPSNAADEDVLRLVEEVAERDEHDDWGTALYES